MAFGTRPAFLGARMWSAWVCVVALLGFRVAWTLLALVLNYPSWLFWLAVVVAAALVLAKARDVTVGLVGWSAAAMVLYSLVEFPIVNARDSALGYDQSHQSISIPAVIAAAGAIGLGLALCCLVDEQARTAVGSWVAPRGAIDVTRALVIALLVVTAVFPVVRAVSGNTSFSVLVAADEQNLFPGYATPHQVATTLQTRFQIDGYRVTSVKCSYFAPNLPAPPVYDCDAIVSASSGQTEHHDNIEGKGRSDGTFSCEDDTSGVSWRLC